MHYLRSLKSELTPTAGRWHALAAAAAFAVAVAATTARAQVAGGTQQLVLAPPEPIYWKQNLFLIPYQWSSAADPGAAQAVWLLVSRDQGVSWQKISEARPQVKAFNYRAEGDGEYWFAIRTLDRNGQLQPPGPYRPELRVIVDTSMPRIESLSAEWRSDGALQIEWRASDRNLDSGSWKFEAQLDATGTWQPLPVADSAHSLSSPPAAALGQDVNSGQTVWQPPPGSQPRALRATVYDRAGNSASYGVAIAAVPSSTTVREQTTSTTGDSALLPPAATGPPGWVSASEAPSASPHSTTTGTDQPWPPGVVASAPFRLSSDRSPQVGDSVTSYGNPAVVGARLANSGDRREMLEPPIVAAKPGVDERPTVTPLEPYREASVPVQRASVTRLPPVDEASAMPPAGPPVQALPQPAATTVQYPDAQPPRGVEPKRVGSRTFALEYEIEEIGRWGIAKIELWGTRDGGTTWRCYTSDDDHRSPVVVTVDGPGMYGFRIVVESAGAGISDPPRAGDEPELWVEVDLNRPIAELVAIEPGADGRADHLTLKWRAEDDNLLDRPIALFYSSRPAGPWSAIATNLENTGQYTWQVPRHVPERFYVRLEARDTAGNLAAFQTREPVVFGAAQPVGRLVAPTSSGRREW